VGEKSPFYVLSVDMDLELLVLRVVVVVVEVRGVREGWTSAMLEKLVAYAFDFCKLGEFWRRRFD
jgi:hypothetical protein